MLAPSESAQGLHGCMQGVITVLSGLAKQDVKRAQLITGKGEIFRVMTEQLGLVLSAR